MSTLGKKDHLAVLHAKIKDNITYADLDPRVVELAKEEFETFENDMKTTPENLLVFQIIGEAVAPNTFKIQKASGHLFSTSYFGNNIYSVEELVADVEHESSAPLKVELLSGYLFKCAPTYKYKYYIKSFAADNSIGFGFRLGVWNNKYPHLTKEHCENMMGRVVNLIGEKYFSMVEILEKGSW